MGENSSKAADEAKMHEKLLKLLECPICFDTFSLPVALCRENGHAICRNCCKSVNRCPYCKSRWSSDRNILVEQLLQTLLHRCLFCQLFIPVGERYEHERIQCGKKVIQCFIFSRGGRCHFFIPRDSLWEHLYHKHGRIIRKIYFNETVEMPIKNIFFTKNFSVLYDVKFGSTLKRPNLNILFRVFGDKEKKILFFSANVLKGDENGTQKFAFRFGIWRKNTEMSAFVGQCIPIAQIPEMPDRYPGGHPNARGFVPKSDHIFFDPAEHLYWFSLEILKNKC